MKPNFKIITIGIFVNMAILTLYSYLDQFVFFIPEYTIVKGETILVHGQDWYAFPFAVGWFVLQSTAIMATIMKGLESE